MVKMDLQVKKEIGDLVEEMDLLVRKVKQGSVFVVHLVEMEKKVIKEEMDKMEKEVEVDLLVPLESQVYLAHLDQKASKEIVVL